MNVSVIGLGLMGTPIARNLLKAGHTVTVYNRTRARAELLAADGARVAGSVAEACQSPVVMTMLADDTALEAVVFGPGGLAASLAAGGTHVSMSTISAALSARLQAAHGAAGQRLVAAPVFGRPEAALAAKLFILAAGAPEAIDDCQPLFDAVGQKTFRLGPDPVAANVAKLSGNFLMAAALESMGEAFALVRTYGIDPLQYHALLASTLFATPAWPVYAGIIARGEYEPAGFKLPLGLKDVRLALAAGEAKNVALPMGSLVRDRLINALALGYENKDWAAIALLAARDAGLTE